jgi:hypothetical protein
MTRHKAFRSGALLFGVLVLLFGFLSSCGDDTPTGTETTTQNGQGDVNPYGDTDFFLGSVSFDGTPDGRIDVWGHNLTTEGDSVASFDLVLINRSRHTIFPLVIFYITQITPADVVVLNADITTVTGLPVGFDFSDKLGDDNKLDPGETSGAVTMRFGMPEPTSFALGFHIAVGEPPNDAVLSGVVFADVNENGEYEPDMDQGLPEILVRLWTTVSDSDSTGFEFVRATRTNEEGRYGFSDLRPGVYQVAADGPNARPTTPNPLLVTLIAKPDGTVEPFDGADFGFADHVVPPPPPAEILFGPAPVGPGSPHGTELDATFELLGMPGEEVIVMEITPPMNMPPISPVHRAGVWINGQQIFEMDCLTTNPGCNHNHLLRIPPEVLVKGENHLGIGVTGGDRAVLVFTIFREIND